MLTTPRLHLARFTERARRFSIGSAWFFIILSLLHLGWVVVVKGAEPGGLTTLYQTSVMTAGGEEVHRAFGLTYDGFLGLLLALVQAAGVATAAAFSVVGRGRLRLLAHGTLIAWAGLWMFDLMYLAGVDKTVGSFSQATLMAFLAGATVVRAIAGRRPPTKSTPGSTPGPVLTADDIVAAPEVEEIATPPAPRLERIRHRARELATTAVNRGRRVVRERWPRKTSKHGEATV